MEINCVFEYRSNFTKRIYTCIVEEANIIEKYNVLKEFKGVHKNGKSHKDVQCVWFNKTTVNHFPRGLEKHFPNVANLEIVKNNLDEISRNDLKGLKGLVSLYIEIGQLSSLPDDLLNEMPNLRIVSFYGHKIEFASSNLLKPLLGRENVKVNLGGNKNIDVCYWPGRDDSLASLYELMDLIDRKCNKPAPVTFHPGHSKDSDPENFNPKLKKINEMWISGKFSDLTIIAGNKEFKVHKAVLGMESEVFAQILEDQNEATEIKIPNFSANSVEALLKFIYTSEASKDGNAKENFDIADKFKITAMKTFYEKIICDQINEENAWETFLFAHRFSSQLLKEKAFQQIAKKIPDELAGELMEDSDNLKTLLDAREVYDDARRKYEEILEKSKNLNNNKK